MERWAFAVCALGLLAAPVAAEAQPAAKVYRIGFLSSTGCPIRPEIMGPFRQGLLEFNYVEGQNFTIECRGARGATDHLPVFAAELVRLNVDVLVSVGTASAQAAKHATTTIPIVMVSVGDPVGSGLVTDLARPGGNVTGLSALAPGMVPKAVEFLKEAKAAERYQFERLAYFTLDQDSSPGRPVFNRTITLKDTWAKETKKG